MRREQSRPAPASEPFPAEDSLAAGASPTRTGSRYSAVTPADRVRVLSPQEMLKCAQALDVYQGSKDDDDYTMIKSMFEMMKAEEDAMQVQTHVRMQVNCRPPPRPHTRANPCFVLMAHAPVVKRTRAHDCGSAWPGIGLRLR